MLDNKVKLILFSYSHFQSEQEEKMRAMAAKARAERAAAPRMKDEDEGAKEREAIRWVIGEPGLKGGGGWKKIKNQERNEVVVIIWDYCESCELGVSQLA